MKLATISTDFTDASTSCGSSVAGMNLKDQDTLANLEWVSIFQINQIRILSIVMWELTMESFRIENYGLQANNTYTARLLCLPKRFCT